MLSYHFFKSEELILQTIKSFKNIFSTTIITLTAIVCLYCHSAIAHETSESDVTKRCTIVKSMVDLGGQKFPESQLKVALTSEEIYAAAGGKDDASSIQTIALTASVIVDGVKTSISGNLQGILIHQGSIVAGTGLLMVDYEVPFESKDVEITNCTVYY